jgi:hypothetical protein
MTDIREQLRDSLARYVLSLQPLATRRAWLAHYESLHGPEAADDLKARMVRIHGEGKG